MKKILQSLVLFTLIIALLTVSSGQVSAAQGNPYYIKVNKGTNVVTIYKKDGTPHKAMICSAGVPTPVGTFYTPVKYRWKELINNSYGQYSTRIVGGFLFHSVYYWKNGDPSTMSTSAYNLLGTLQSKGCIRLMVKDAKWIYDNCPLGTKVTIFNGTSKDDPLGKPTYSKITNGRYTNWDPTDPDPNNPWRDQKPSISVIKKTVQYKSKFKPLNHVIIRDSLGNEITEGVKVKGKVNTKKLGRYKVTYSFKDKLKRSIKKTYTFKVVNTSKPSISGVKKKNAALGEKVNLKSGVTAKAKTGGKLTSKIRIYYRAKKSAKYKYIKSNKITFKKSGTYQLKYYVKGKNKKTRTVYTTIKVINKRVKLSVKNKTIEYGASYKPTSYVSLKNYKGKKLSLAKNLSIKNPVNVRKLGTYTVTYTGTDSKRSYTKVTKKVKVRVVNNLTPSISAPNQMIVSAGQQVNLRSNVTAKSATGVNLTGYIKVFVNGTLMTQPIYSFEEGETYKIEYQVSVPGGTKVAKHITTVQIAEPETEAEIQN